MSDDMEHEYQKSNREKSMAAVKRGAFWCCKCDAYLVGVGQKCGNCGAKPERRTLKKETNAT